LQLILYMSVCGAIVYLIDVLIWLRREAEAVAAEQRRLAEELAEANRVKDQFLATVSHELRTPLTAIVGWADLLKSGGLSEEKVAKALDTIHRNARIQAQLIADLLDVARITSGKLRIEPRETDASAIVAAAVQTVAPAARARGIELETDCEEGATLSADPDRLQQVIWNLLSNAVKFTPPHGRVQAAVRVADDAVHITVSDTGPGLRPEFIPHLFERFRQDGDGRRSPGLGLGLSIVKDIVHMHGGTVSAANRAPGPGAAFEIVLPRHRDTSARGMASTSRRALRRHRLSGLRILAVDDDAEARELIDCMLTELGAEVVTAGSVAEAMSSLGRCEPDVILTDLSMPGEDGYDLLRQLRRRHRGKDQIPIAALSASTARTQRPSAADDFTLQLPKPIGPDELADAILDLARPH
jgi:CheY-like chemotaxis protein/nitrogen-specific signal transduction histidine kinase